MRRTNLLKMSTCVIGLGMMLSGINSMAMEKRYSDVSAGIEESKRAAFEEVYNQEIISGKREIYARNYAKLVVVDGVEESLARCAAEMLAEDWALDCAIARNRLYDAERMNELYGEEETETSEEIDESKRAAFEEVYNQELASGKSELYAEHYAKLVVVDGIDRSQAEIRAKIFDRYMASSERGKEFSEGCAKLIADGYREKEAKWETKARLQIKSESINKKVTPKRRINPYIYSMPAKMDYVGKDFIPMEFLTAESAIKVTRRELIEGSNNFYKRFFKQIIDKGIDSSEIEREIRNGKTNIYAFHYLKRKSDLGWHFTESWERERAEEIENKIKNDGDFSYFFVELINKGLKYNEAVEGAEMACERFKKGNSREDSLYYAGLVAKRVAPSTASQYIDEFKRLIKKGKSEPYAHFYAYYLVKEVIKPEAKGVKDPVTDLAKVERMATMAEKEVLSGKSNIYAFHYTGLINEGVDEAEARKRAELFEIGKSKFAGTKSDTFIRICARLMCEGMDENKANEIATMAEKGADSDEDRAICYAKLVILNGISEKKARTLSSKVVSMLKSGKSKIYVKFYSELYDRGTYMFDIERQATIAEREVIEGKSYDYALYYSELIVGGLSEGMARRKAEQFEQERRTKKSKIFLEFFSKSTEKGLKESKATRQAIIAEEKFKEGHSKEASLYYAELMTSGLRINKAMRQMEVFEGQMRVGKSDLYARFFAKSIGRGLDIDTARKQAETAERLFFEKYFEPNGYLYKYDINYDASNGELVVSEKILEKVKDNGETIEAVRCLYREYFEHAKFKSFYNAELLVSGMEESDAGYSSGRFVYKNACDFKVFC